MYRTDEVGAKLNLHVAISVFLDLVLSGLPIYCMWKIQMSWKSKIAIGGLMSLGVLYVQSVSCSADLVNANRVVLLLVPWCG